MSDASRETSLLEKVGDHGGFGGDSVTHSPTKKAYINSSSWYSIKIKNRGKRMNKRNKQTSSQPVVIFSPSSPKGNGVEARDDDDVALNRQSDEHKNAVDDNNTLSELIPTTISVLTLGLIDNERDENSIIEEPQKRLTIIESIRDVSLDDYMYLSESLSGSVSIDKREYEAFVWEEDERENVATVDHDIIDNSSPNRDGVLGISLANAFCSPLSPLHQFRVDEFEARVIIEFCEALEDDIRVDEFEAREIAKIADAGCYTSTALEDDDDNGSYLVYGDHFKDKSTEEVEGDAAEAETCDGVHAVSIVSLSSPYVMPMRKSSIPVPEGIWKNKPLVEDFDKIKANTAEVPQVVDAIQEDTTLVTTNTKNYDSKDYVGRFLDGNPILKVFRKKESSVQPLTGNRSNKWVRKSPLRFMAMLRKTKKKEASVKGIPVTTIDAVEIAEKDDIKDSSDEKKKEAMVKGILETKIAIASIDAVEIAEKDDIKDSSDEIKDDFQTLPLKTNQNDNDEENHEDCGSVHESGDNKGDAVNMESLLRATARLKLSLERYDETINSKYNNCSGDDKQWLPSF
jgi:hypothetical protein